MKALISGLYSKVFLADKYYLTLLLAGLLANGLIWGLIFLNQSVLIQPGQEFIPLHYKVLFGIDFLSYWYYIFVLPGAGLLMIITNAFLARLVQNYEKILVYAFLATALVIQFILAWALHLIIQVNIF